MKADNAILTRPNPFADCYVDSPWDELEDDVPSIHGAVRKSLEDAVASVATSWASRGMLIVGPAGAGKSHLLAWLQKSVAERALFVAVPPFTDPRRVFRHILRAIVDDLLRRRTSEGPRQVDWLLDTLLREIHKSTGVGASFSAFRTQAVATPDATKATVKSIARFLANRGIDVDRDVLAGFVELEAPKRSDIAAEWLRGEALDPEDLAVIGATHSLIPPDSTAAAAEERAREIVGQIGTLGLLFRPVVLAFDRTEALGDVPSVKGVDALTRAICLLHAMPNFVLVTTVEATFWHERVERAMLASHRARVAEDEHFLRGIRGHEATALIASRMGRVWLGGERPPIPTHPFTPEFITVVDAAREDVRTLMARCRHEIDRMRGAKRVESVGAEAASAPAVEPLETVVEAYYDSAFRSAREQTVRQEDEDIRDVLARILEAAARAERPIAGLKVEVAGRVDGDGVGIAFQPRAGEAYGIGIYNAPSLAPLVPMFHAQLKGIQGGRLKRAFTLRRGGARGLRGPLPALEQKMRAHGGLVELDRKSAAALVAVQRLISGTAQGDIAPGGRRSDPEDGLRILLQRGAFDDLPVFRALAAAVALGKGEAAMAGTLPPAPAGRDWISSASGQERAAIAREDVERSFAELIGQLELANLPVVEDHLRRAYPALDRETILEVGRDLKDKHKVRVIQAAGGSHPVYCKA